MCSLDVVMVDTRDKRFGATLNHMFETSSFNSQCMGVKGGVNLKYARQYMKPRATVIASIPQVPCKKNGYCVCGFGLAFMKFVPELNASVFYIDLLCSQKRQGGRVLVALEAYGKQQGAKVVALRAAEPKLVSIYQRKGYNRVADACLPPSRAGRVALRSLDRFANSEGRNNDGTVKGVYTDGTRTVKSHIDAWRAVKHTRPARASRLALPDGWWFEEGGHGWWMSKCLVV